MIMDYLVKYRELNPDTPIRELREIFGISIDEIIKGLGYDNYNLNDCSLTIKINKYLELVENNSCGSSQFIHYNKSGAITKIVYCDKDNTQILF